MRHFGLVFVILALGCGGGDDGQDAGPEPDAPPATGTVSLSWTLSDGAQTISCGDAGALTISLQLVPVTGGAGEVEGFVCDDGAGTSLPIDAAAYNATLSVLGSGAVVLGDRQTINGVEVTQGADTQLGEIEFVIPQP